MSKLLEKFKSLIYADMACNRANTGQYFNNDWREDLNEEEKEFWREHASRISNAMDEREK